MNIGIIGLGLLGGSLAKSFKKTHPDNSYIVALDSCNKTLSKAKEDGAIDHYTSIIDRSFSECNVIFICTPISSIPDIVKELIPHVGRDCVITDVGSTKHKVVKEVNLLLKENNCKAHFVGGHPMTGSEHSGYMYSQAHLFQNAYYIITPYGNSPDFIVFIIRKLVERIGAIPIILSPSYHDFAAASVSHVPHIIAAALVQLIRDSDDTDNFLHTLAAGGFKDITRIASSNPDIWQDICISNKSQILKVLNRYIDILTNTKTSIETNNKDAIYNHFNDAKLYRDTFDSYAPGPINKVYKLFVDVKDTPGIIANIASLLSKNHINIKNIGIVNHREFHSGVLQITMENKSDIINGIEVLTKNNYKVFN